MCQAPLDVLRRLGAMQLDAIQVADKAHRRVCLALVGDLTGGVALDVIVRPWTHASGSNPVGGTAAGLSEGGSEC